MRLQGDVLEGGRVVGLRSVCANRVQFVPEMSGELSICNNKRPYQNKCAECVLRLPDAEYYDRLKRQFRVNCQSVSQLRRFTVEMCNFSLPTLQIENNCVHWLT